MLVLAQTNPTNELPEVHCTNSDIAIVKRRHLNSSSITVLGNESREAESPTLCVPFSAIDSLIIVRRLNSAELHRALSRGKDELATGKTQASEL